MTVSNKDFSFEIKSHLAVLSRSSNGWTKEINLVSWNGNAPKMDIREWDANHQHMSKGITLKKDEAEILLKAVYLQLKKEKEAAVRAAKAAEEEQKLQEDMEKELNDAADEPACDEFELVCEPVPVDEDGCVMEMTGEAEDSSET